MASVQKHEPIINPLYEILLPYLNKSSASKLISANDPNINAYLNHLTTLSLSSLTTTEPQSLSQTKNSIRLSLQTLSKQTHNSIISSCSRLSILSTKIPLIIKSTALLKDNLPQLDEAVFTFSNSYNSRSENELLYRRRTALLLSRNVDRIYSILELPALLSSSVQSSNQTALSTLNYASALDLNAHIRRLHSLYPDSAIIKSIKLQSEETMRVMTSNLILYLRSNSLKLAGAMRIISWLRRVSPELDSFESGKGALELLFLTCRLANLRQMLTALEPLRDLADQEAKCIERVSDNKTKWESGQQTERYLKRYIEIFREQSFAIISMYRSIFLNISGTEIDSSKENGSEDFQGQISLESASKILATFPLHLVSMLTGTLKTYLPNVRERSSRDSLLTQVLYCANSLSRLGSDFSMILSFLDEETDDDNDEEWAEVIKKHRMLAGRLELMVRSRDI